MTTSSSIQGHYGWPEGLSGVYYGPGSVSTALPKLLSSFGARKTLIVTTRSLVGKTEIVKQVESILKDHNAFGATFYEIGEHAPIAGIRRAVKIFQESGCNIIVSIGGGSPIDASKAILYFAQEESGGPILPQIAIPTTLSAAEYTIGAGYTNDQGQKAVVSSKRLIPASIILDAELTLPTPERLWLSTGIRALDHAVENLYRPGVAFPVKVLCNSAIADLFTYLPASKANPQDVEVRQRLQLASWMSIWPMTLERYGPLGLSHALGHKLGAAYGIPHGITSCLTLAPVVAIKAQTESQENKETLAKVLPYLHLESTGSVDTDVLLLSKSIKEYVGSILLYLFRA
ncbi:alcohol dehydrogenase IV [Armillaria novae-zelandiae]|uniref:Alcohol dehydrogenase IV n=1 Tax=Armillaria novae-zelandiae TaxID=153914 RepID=A0AA39NZM4_9AGAR|nr:alcohol dehydrogenase IV [Armillaria novae-zelandiae]